MEKSYYPKNRASNMSRKDFKVDIKTLIWTELLWITYHSKTSEKLTTVDVINNAFDIWFVERIEGKVIITIRE